MNSDQESITTDIISDNQHETSTSHEYHNGSQDNEHQHGLSALLPEDCCETEWSEVPGVNGTPDENVPQLFPDPSAPTPHNFYFNLYQRQLHLYAPPQILVPFIPYQHQPTLMVPNEEYLGCIQTDEGHETQEDVVVTQGFENLPEFCVAENPIVPSSIPQSFCRDSPEYNDAFEVEETLPEEPTTEEIREVNMPIPPWVKVDLLEEEEPQELLKPKSKSRVRLVEYIGDQYHEKNPHTRRTILLNQKRSSDNDPLVFYRFYQFSCPCMGKVWFSPLHRAKDGCYCRDCHQFVKPFGHIDGLTPYMGHEFCYAKFQCHHCGRNWSCHKSRSNFPDNCFSCGTIVYPYYQVSHSVLKRKILRQNNDHDIRFRNLMYTGSSNSSLEDEEEYQMIFHEDIPQAGCKEVFPHTAIQDNIGKRRPLSSISLTSINRGGSKEQEQLSWGASAMQLRRCVSDTSIIVAKLCNHCRKHDWTFPDS